MVIPTLTADKRLVECLEALARQTRTDFEVIVVDNSGKGLVRGGAAGQSGATVEIAVSDSYVNDFLATSDGLALVKAFTHIRDPKLRRAIVGLVQQITPEDD